MNLGMGNKTRVMLGKNSMYGINPTQTPWIVHGENADRQFITPIFPVL
jgi:hypothetical protein